MRIALLTMGSVGDVQPMMVLGVALRSRGHDVVLVTSPEYRAMADRAGLELRPLPTADGFVSAVLSSERVRAALRKGPSKIRMGLAAPQQSFADRRALTDEMLAAVTDADLLVHTLFVRILALDWPDLPSCLVPPHPATPTAQWPALGTPALPLGPGYNRLTHRVIDTLEWLVMRQGINKVRRTEERAPLGLRSPYLGDGIDRPVLYGFSSQIFPPPADWPPLCHVTGFWSADSTSQREEPDAGLGAFLDRGDRPLVASYGSALMVDGPGLLGATLAAARQTGHRLVIVGGPRLDLPADLDVVRVDRADFGRLLPRAAAMLYHGAPGTAGATIAAGIPHVTVPTFGDQPMWARRLTTIGVAAPPVPYHKLTAERLAAAIRTAVTDPGIAARTAALATTARDDGGVERAVDVIEAYAKVRGV
jgi:UDP:flavonoid glycosyltransferase YjiC (YdhE family)